MESTKRDLLGKGQTLLLALEPGGKSFQEYMIQSVVGEGGSSVCYEAIRMKDSQPGKLKEFYPIDSASQDWYYSLERLPNGQLIPKGGTVRKFTEMCRDYLDTYAILNQVMVENPKNQVLKNYIQNVEPLYGVADPNASSSDCFAQQRFGATVYCWSPGIMGQSFDEFLLDVRKSPENNADQKLYDIVNTTFTLVDCICALHSAGLLHLDIKPSNFLVPYNSKDGINSNSISLFDVNTLYSVRSDIPRLAGTEGFRSPEVFKGKADNRSDIYSIGAMLFYAIVISKDIPDGIYRDAYFPYIDKMVKYSLLIKNSSAGSKQVSKLSNIIKKCLARNPNERYDSCASLMEDLEKARFDAEKNAIDPKLIGQNKKLAVVDVNEIGINSPDIVIQKLLYEHPLYEALEPGKTKINVLVIGSGTYGQKFIDHCLQAGQMKDFTICVTAVSNTPKEDMESYLQFRPALSRFVNVNGSMEKTDKAGKTTVDPRAYGTVQFQSLNQACGDDSGDNLSFDMADNENARAKNTRIVAEMIEHTVDSDDHNRIFDYIFIALGSTRINQEIAQMYEAETSGWGKDVKCPICYIYEHKKKAPRVKNSLLYPVYVKEPITPKSIDPALEQMAFNTHIAYDSNLNIDLRAALEKFRKNEYNYSSSLAYALSIPYKLFSIGIVTQNHAKSLAQEQFPGKRIVRNALEAARLFNDTVLSVKESNEDAKRKFDALVCLEHQRWVLAKITDGWDIPRDKNGQFDLEQCIVSGSVQNKIMRTHPCLVFSTEKTPLSTDEYKENGYVKWDAPDIDPGLDELDRMSVELHQRFQVHASRFKANNPLQSEDMQVIEALLLSADESIVRAYKQFQFCLKNILNGMMSYTKQYDYYEQCFVDELKKLPAEIAQKIEERVSLIRKAFYPVKEANLYRNYKAYDEVLVEKIPFILTYCFHGSIAIAFADGKDQNGRNEAVFSNVASATVLSPEKTFYLFHYTEDTKPDLLINKLDAVINYLSKRRVHCSVYLAVVFPEAINSKKREGLQKRLEALKNLDYEGKNAVFQDYKFLDYMNLDEAHQQILDYLEAEQVSLYDGSANLFASCLDQSDFVSAVLRKKIPYFEFNWKDKVFTQHRNCDYLEYIHDRSSIRIQDMFALMNAEDTRFHLPEFAEDYLTLWGIYTGSDSPGEKFDECVGTWNNLCMLLEKYEKRQKPIATLYPPRFAQQKMEYEYLLPEYTFRAVQSILAKLVEFKVIDENSHVSNYTSENCKAQIVAPIEYEKAFDALFARPEILLGYYGIEVVKRMGYHGDFYQIRYQNMDVVKLSLDAEAKGQQEKMLKVLQKLNKHQFINKLTQESDAPGCVSFTYSSRRIKQLLTSAGEILEVYTYYQLLNTGYFDDVACGYEFRWQDGDVRNELDLVATKGFRSIIVECKAVQQLELGYYHKLHSIADHFGIGTEKVLVGNTYRKNDVVITASNKMQRSRGNQLNIITIFEPAKINNIGQTLVDIMKK